MSTDKKSNKLKLGGRIGLIGFALAGFSLGLGGCKPAEDEVCVSNEDFFKDQIWAPYLSQQCISCHNSTGAAKDSQFVLQSSSLTGYLEANLATVERLAKLEYEGQPWLIAKPTAAVEHGGGEQFATDSDEYDAFVELVERIRNPVECADDGSDVETYFADVGMLSDVETLRKASLSLVGRLPTPEEEFEVHNGGLEALDLVLDGMMTEDAFFDRIVEVYNDHFLTDRYIPNVDAIDLLDGEDYPGGYWFEAIEDEGERAIARRNSNEAVAREALQLIAHVVREDRPFTEILTADYVMVNPFSAQVYGVNASFSDSSNPNEWAEAKLPGIPHSGVLTSYMWLNRFPTTPTNRNRHRSRMVYKQFLATDVLKLAERPIDPTAIEDFNPTRESDACVVCHAVIDPVAGSLQNWDTLGRYRPPEEGWFQEMFAPGFGDSELPPGEKTNAATWLASLITEDPRFATSQVNIMFQGLTGDVALSEPSDPASPTYVGQLVAWEAQNDELQRIAQVFIESEYDLKMVVKEIVKSPYYRAKDFEPGWDEDQAQSEDAQQRLDELWNVGTSRWLTPEQLERKVEAVTGYPWRETPTGTSYLLSINEYKIFYGGIDSDTIVERMTEPNGIMTNVSMRMANEVACWNTARDFTKPAAVRNLFPYVDPGFEPEDANGFEIPAITESIRKNLQFLHWRLLGEQLEVDSAEIDRTYALFLEVWRDGKRGIGLGEYPVGLPGECQANTDFESQQGLSDAERIQNDPTYTIRAWMAVLSYLLSDYRFLHE